MKLENTQAGRPRGARAARGTAKAVRFADWLMARTAEDELLRKGDRTRFALKAAAARLLEERGYESFSMGDVCDEVGITRTAFYKYFPNKQALVLELLGDFQDLLVETFRGPREDGAPGARGTAEAVYESNLAYVRLFAVNARVIVSIQQVRRALSDAERLQFDLNDWWARKIANAIVERGGPAARRRSRHALATAYALESMVDGFLTELYVRRNPNLVGLALSDTEVARVLTDAWVGAWTRKG